MNELRYLRARKAVLACLADTQRLNQALRLKRLSRNEHFIDIAWKLVNMRLKKSAGLYAAAPILFKSVIALKRLFGKARAQGSKTGD